MYVPIAGSSLVKVYNMQTMTFVNTFPQSCNIAFFDMTFDSNSNVQNTAVKCQNVLMFLFNESLPICFSDKYLIEQHTTYLYDISSVNFNMISTTVCLVFDDTIYFSSNSAVQLMNISVSSPHTVYSMSHYPDALTQYE